MGDDYVLQLNLVFSRMILSKPEKNMKKGISFVVILAAERQQTHDVNVCMKRKYSQDKVKFAKQNCLLVQKPFFQNSRNSLFENTILIVKTKQPSRDFFDL